MGKRMQFLSFLAMVWILVFTTGAQATGEVEELVEELKEFKVETTIAGYFSGEFAVKGLIKDQISEFILGVKSLKGDFLYIEKPHHQFQRCITLVIDTK